MIYDKIIAGEVKDIKDICIEIYKKTYPNKDLNWNTFSRWLRNSINNNTGVAIVMRDDDKPVGFVIGLLTIDFHTGNLVANELHWIVKDGYNGNGLQLMKMFIQWAKDMCADEILSGGDIKHKRVYERFGFTALRMEYYMEV